LKKIWKTKDGKNLKIKDMDTKHIKNCLKMLKERNFISIKSFNLFLNSYDNQSDMVQLCLEREYINKIPNQFIDFFEEELKKRGIKNEI